MSRSVWQSTYIKASVGKIKNKTPVLREHLKSLRYFHYNAEDTEYSNKYDLENTKPIYSYISCSVTLRLEYFVHISNNTRLLYSLTFSFPGTLLEKLSVFCYWKKWSDVRILFYLVWNINTILNIEKNSPFLGYCIY